MNERLTYNEWVASGYHIKAGSKMVGRNAAGVAVFSVSQVEVNTPLPYTSRRRNYTGVIGSYSGMGFQMENDDESYEADLFYGLPDDDLGDKD